MGRGSSRRHEQQNKPKGSHILLTIVVQGDSADPAQQEPRPNDQQERNQHPPLPGTFLGKPADGEGEYKTEATYHENGDNNTSQQKGHVSALSYRVVGVWTGAKPGEKLMALLTVVIIGVNALQWKAVRGQLDQMQVDSKSRSEETAAQLKQMQDATKLEYRPWVGIRQTHAEPLAVGKPVSCRVELANTGKTPALHLRMISLTCIWPPYNKMSGKILTEVFDSFFISVSAGYQFRHGIESSLAPNATIGNDSICSFEVSDQLASELKEKKWSLYVIGVALYDDVLGQHHTTRYLFFVDCEKMGWTQCNEYNGMD
jgi:hypothetical protein